MKGHLGPPFLMKLAAMIFFIQFFFGCNPSPGDPLGVETIANRVRDQLPYKFVTKEAVLKALELLDRRSDVYSPGRGVWAITPI